MSWERDILDTTTDELVRRNGAQFLAVLLHKSVRNNLEDAERHRQEVALLKAHLSDAHKAGLRAFEAQRQGRKTVRLDQLLGD